MSRLDTLPAQAGTVAFLGLRSPAEREASVDRIAGFTGMQRAFWEEAERLEDATQLRQRLYLTRVPSTVWFDRLGNSVLDHDGWTRRNLLQKRIERVCQWAKRRMKRQDDAWRLRFTPVRGEAA